MADAKILPIESAGVTFSVRQLDCAGETVRYRLVTAAATAASTSTPVSAPPWLLLHGAGHDGGVWEPLAASLALAGAPVYLPDLPAHGGSGGVPRTSIEDFARWTLGVLDALGLQQVRLVGHSMGSLIALALAARAPQRCTSLALLGSSVPLPVAPFLLEAVLAEPERAFALINKFSFAVPASEDGEAVARHQQLLTDNLTRMRAAGGEVLAHDLHACDRWQGGEAAARSLQVPVLVLGAELDRMTPLAASLALLALFAGNQAGAIHRQLAGCGHGMMLEQPAALAQTLFEHAGLTPFDTTAIQC